MAEFLRERRRDLGMSTQTVAYRAGISEKTVRTYETKGLPPRRQHYEKLDSYARAIGITREGMDRLLRGQLPSPDDLFVPDYPEEGEAGVHWEESPVSIPEWTISTSATRWVAVPLCSLDYDDPEQRRVIETGRFRLRIDGNCMEPDYPHGAVVEFQIVRAYEPLIIGCDYVVCRSDGTATFKALVGMDDDVITLAARNQARFPGTFDVARQELTRVARAIAVMMPAAGPRPVQIRMTKRK